MHGWGIRPSTLCPPALHGLGRQAGWLDLGRVGEEEGEEEDVRGCDLVITCACRARYCDAHNKISRESMITISGVSSPLRPITSLPPGRFLGACAEIRGKRRNIVRTPQTETLAISPIVHMTARISSVDHLLASAFPCFDSADAACFVSHVWLLAGVRLQVQRGKLQGPRKSA